MAVQYSIVTNFESSDQIIKPRCSSKSNHFSLIMISVLGELRSKSRFPQMSTTKINGKGKEIFTWFSFPFQDSGKSEEGT